MTAKKTIILLYPPHTLHILKIKKSLTNYCQDNNFTIVDIISAKNEYDSKALRQFIELVSAQKESVNLIIDYKTYTSLPQHIFTWCVFGTLLIAGLIDTVYVYQNNNEFSPNKTSVILKKSEVNFLDLSSFYFQTIMTPVDPTLSN